MSFEDGDGNCELGFGCFKKRLRNDEGKWAWCKCYLILHITPWVCVLGLGCQFGFTWDAAGQHDCKCKTICARCLKHERGCGLLCDVCCHELYHGTVRKLQSGKFYKMYRSGTMEGFDETVPAYSKISEKTVNKCGRCLQEIYDATKADGQI